MKRLIATIIASLAALSAAAEIVTRVCLDIDASGNIVGISIQKVDAGPSAEEIRKAELAKKRAELASKIDALQSELDLLPEESPAEVEDPVENQD